MTRPRGHYERTGAPLAQLGTVPDARLTGRLEQGSDVLPEFRLERKS